jgi:diketogulonate reductase-like aldo/keto reductase
MLSRRSLIEASLGSAILLAASRSSLLMATGEQMLVRSIPASGESLPVIGMGTSGSFDVPASEEALSPLREVLRLLLDKGGRVLDTAPSYGRAQTVSGLLLEQGGWRENVFLASKLGVRGRERGLAQFEESLRALRSKRLDLLQVHNLIDYRTLLGLLRDLKAQGRIRYLGVTHYLEAAHDELVGIVERESLDFLQINLSVVSRNAERRLLPLCREKGVAVLINRAFEGGQLFARVKSRELPRWAADIDCSSWAQVFLKYVISHPAVTCVIPASSDPRHMADNLLAGFGRMPDTAQRARIAAYFA